MPRDLKVKIPNNNPYGKVICVKYSIIAGEVIVTEIAQDLFNDLEEEDDDYSYFIVGLD